MNPRSTSELELFSVIHQREFETAARALETFPPGELDARPAGSRCTGREWAQAILEQEDLIRELIQGKAADVAETPVAPGPLLATLRASHRETRAALATLTEAQWNAPYRDLVDLWEPVRRSQLLWIALDGMIDQVRQIVDHRFAAEDELGPTGEHRSQLQPS